MKPAARHAELERSVGKWLQTIELTALGAIRNAMDRMRPKLRAAMATASFGAAPPPKKRARQRRKRRRPALTGKT